jgi:hypothetical protein
VVLAYARRYEPEALADGRLEILARLHNGGWNWREKPSSLDYWRRAQKHLTAENAENAE